MKLLTVRSEYQGTSAGSYLRNARCPVCKVVNWVDPARNFKPARKNQINKDWEDKPAVCEHFQQLETPGQPSAFLFKKTASKESRKIDCALEHPHSGPHKTQEQLDRKRKKKEPSEDPSVNSFLAQLNEGIDPEEERAEILGNGRARIRASDTGNWLKLRVPLENEPTVADLVHKGDSVTTSWDTGPCEVVEVAEYQTYGIQTFSLVVADEETQKQRKKNGEFRKNAQFGYINELVAEKGKILGLFVENKDEVFVREKEPEEKPRKIYGADVSWPDGSMGHKGNPVITPWEESPKVKAKAGSLTPNSGKTEEKGLIHIKAEKTQIGAWNEDHTPKERWGYSPKRRCPIRTGNADHDLFHIPGLPLVNLDGTTIEGESVCEHFVEFDLANENYVVRKAGNARRKKTTAASWSEVLHPVTGPETKKRRRRLRLPVLAIGQVLQLRNLDEFYPSNQAGLSEFFEMERGG